jgi:hypothetical protein
MKKDLYKKAQKGALYTLFIIDLKNSSALLKTKFGRKVFQDTYYELKEFLIDKPVIDIEDDGIKRQIIRQGDLFAIITVSYKADELDKYLNKFLSKREVFFHKGRCLFKTIDPSLRDTDLYFMDAIPILEGIIKNKDINKKDISDKTRTINLKFEIEIEEWLDSEFVESELLYLLSQYGWKGKIK